MKVSTKIMALMVALSAGTTLAASAGTSAGTAIKNVATATFDDPDTGIPGTPVPSNEVTTYINALPGFDIVYTDGTDDTTASTPIAAYDKIDVLPGGKVTTPYVVNNNSNIDNYVINITADTTGSPNAPASVQYYEETDGTSGYSSGDTLVTSVTLSNAGSKDSTTIYQVITIPTGANKGDVYAASPRGTNAGGTTNGVTYTAYAESDNTNTNGDLQYTRATVYTPVLTEVPPPPTTTTVVPPTPGNPGVPGNPVTPPGTPGDPNDPKVPGYEDPNPPGVPGNPNPPGQPGNPGTSIYVDVNGNVQYAYPPSGVTKVTFNNHVTNNGSLDDTVTLFPTDGTGNPIGTNNGDGSFTMPNGMVVKFIDNSGNPLTLANGYPTITAPKGGTVTYRTEVSNFPISATDPVSTTVEIGISSGNKATTTPLVADARTRDVILPPGLQFGDNNGGVPTPGDKGPGNTAQIVNPSQALSTQPVTDATVSTDRTAVFPMIIKNTGEYNDTYTLDNSTVTFNNTAGTTTTSTVRYYYANGTELAKNSSGQYFTSVVLANDSLTVYAVVEVPTDAAATNGTTSGANPDAVVSQKATANYSGAVAVDTNDQITIVSVGRIAVGKFTQVRSTTTLAANDHHVDGSTNPSTVAAGAPSSALHIGNPTNYSAYSGANVNYAPKESYSYQIIGKNTFNTTIKNFFLSDTVDGNLTLGTPTCTVSTGANCTVTVNGSLVTTNKVDLPSGATMTLFIPTTVK